MFCIVSFKMYIRLMYAHIVVENFIAKKKKEFIKLKY